MISKYWFISFTLGIFFSFGAIAKTQNPPNSPTPEDAMRCFQARSTDKFLIEEIQNADPLILAGKGVCPLVIQAIEDRKMPLRRYAILALGDLRCENALPILIKIFQDESEEDYFRGDALEAIWSIEREQGKRYAKTIENGTDYLKLVSKEILNPKAKPKIRTYASALHDVTQSRCLIERGKCSCMEECAAMLSCHMSKDTKNK